MGKILKKNKTILEDIRSLCKMSNPSLHFVEDGLLYRGDIVYRNMCWERYENNREDVLWTDCPLKIIFLMKDYTNESMCDIRYETMRKNGIDPYSNPIKRDAFSMNIIYWLYGLTHSYNFKMIPFEEIKEKDQTCFEFYEKYPLVRINCKKVSGESSLSNALLYQYLNNKAYTEKLSEQIRLFNSDIIVCCGGSGLIKSFVTESVYLGCDKINNWIYLNSTDSTSQKLIIDSYHPSCRMSRKYLYEELMRHYFEFVVNNEYFSNKINKFKKFEETKLNHFKYNVII